MCREGEGRGWNERGDFGRVREGGGEGGIEVSIIQRLPLGYGEEGGGRGGER